MCILWLPVQCFYRILECTNERVPVFCVFSVILFLLVICFVLLWCASFHFIWFYLYFYYTLEACLLPMREKKGVDPDGRKGQDRTGKSRGRGSCDQAIWCKKKISSLKEKINKKKGYTNFLIVGVSTIHLPYPLMFKSVGKVNFLYVTWNCIILVILNSVGFWINK